MNIFKALTLNKHSDYQEVLFTSTLSFLLNPNPEKDVDHCLKDKFLKLFLEQFPFKFSYNKVNEIEVTPEMRLGKKGSVDIFIENKIKKEAIAIEAKIWDSSSKNKSKDGTPQLQRYCEYLSEHYQYNWKLIFLIPDENSKDCIQEFKNIECYKKFKDNIYLLCWNYRQPISIINNFIDIPVLRILTDFINSYEINDATKWIINSLVSIIPEIQHEIKEKKRFPDKDELNKLETNKIFSLFFSRHNRWPNPIHTTVGIPFGKKENKINIHSNSFYRIRTTKAYYTENKDKQIFMPKDIVEIEIWNDVYKKVRVDLKKWLPENCELSSQDDRHLDNNGKTKVKILKIKKITDKEIDKFEQILRKGFEELKRKSCS